MHVGRCSSTVRTGSTAVEECFLTVRDATPEFRVALLTVRRARNAFRKASLNDEARIPGSRGGVPHR